MSATTETTAVERTQVVHQTRSFFNLETTPGYLAIAIGIVLRTWQYVANPSIWVDEAATEDGGIR